MAVDLKAVYPETNPETARRSRLPGIGLCLSGGGFRATLYNLGTLWRLNEFGLLRKLAMVTSVSGGSIVSALLGLRWNELAFDEKGIATKFVDVIATPIQEFCRRRVALPAGISGLLNPFETIGDEMTKAYRQLYAEATLQSLPNPATGAPTFVIYATSLQTASSVRFAYAYLSDYKIGYIANPRISLAQAVAASSAFPPLLSPQHIDLSASAWTLAPGTPFTDSGWLERLILTDGGIYDNMGLEAVWHTYQTVLVSDAGAPLKFEAAPHSDWLRQSLRVLNVVVSQTRALRKRWLIADFKDAGSGVRGAYWGIRSSIADYPDPKDPIVQDTKVTGSLASIRTDLDPFSDEEQGHLINWGYALCDLAIRKWLPEPGHQRGVQPVARYCL